MKLIVDTPTITPAQIADRDTVSDTYADVGAWLHDVKNVAKPEPLVLFEAGL